MTDPVYERKCKNWLEDFTRWCLPRSEAPESFILWTGLFTLAAAARRHVRIPKKYFGSWEASPNLYIIFVAPPGKARKSTTTGYAEELLDRVQKITKAPTIVTQASLLNRIVTESPDASIYILSSEFASFIKKSGVEMFEFLTDLFDGRKNIEASTISRGVEFADKPCINLLAATTPKWIAENMPESVIGGGFASRVIFIFEDKVRRRQLYYEELDQKFLSTMHDNLAEDLNHIANSCYGDFDISEEGKAFMESWYRANADNLPTDNYRLFGYYERKPAHIHKVAMLLHLARSDTLVVELEDFQKAIYLLELVERKLPKAFQSVGKNPYAPDMDTILEFVIERSKFDGDVDNKRDWVSRQDLVKEFYAVAQPLILDELLKGLADMGAITARMFSHDGRDQVFFRATAIAIDLRDKGG